MIVNGTYDETTGTFTFEYTETTAAQTLGQNRQPIIGGTSSTTIGQNRQPTLGTPPATLPKRFTITLNASEVQKIPGAKIDEVSRIAYLDSSQLVKLNRAQEIEIEKPAPKSSIIDAAKWDPNSTTYQAEEPVEEPAYKTGMVVTKEILLSKKGIAQDQATGAITFILPENEQAATLAGKGGILNPSFAVIVPKKSYIGSGMVTSAVAYDAITAQEKLIADLIKENKVDEFKKVLLDRGFYEFSGLKLPEVRSSLAQKGLADSFMRSAVNGFLYLYSQQNYQNIIEDTETFTYDEFANNYKPSFVEESAYVPSRRDADAEIDAAYIENVGRRATDKEKQAFFSALNSEALKDPVRSVPGMGVGPDTRLGGFTETDLADFASEYSLSTPGAEKYGEGFGGYKTFNNVLSSLVSDLENETQFINKPILGENPNAV
jgi:hypothetical protein